MLSRTCSGAGRLSTLGRFFQLVFRQAGALPSVDTHGPREAFPSGACDDEFRDVWKNFSVYRDVDGHTGAVVSLYNPYSIAEFSIEPGSRRWQDALWWMSQTLLTPTQAKEHYKLDFLPAADAGNRFSAVHRRMLHEQGYTEQSDLCCVYVLYERPHDDAPEGKHCVVINGQTVLENPWPFPFTDRLDYIKDLDTHWLEVSLAFLDKMKGTKQPFYLYHATRGCHFDNYPSDDWAGKSMARTVFSDCMVEMDYILGKLVDKLAEVGELDNTLIFSPPITGRNAKSRRMAARRSAARFLRTRSR